jgi:hypothetical protein
MLSWLYTARPERCRDCYQVTSLKADSWLCDDCTGRREREAEPHLDCAGCMELASRLIASRRVQNRSAETDTRVLQRRHWDEVHRDTGSPRPEADRSGRAVA